MFSGFLPSESIVDCQLSVSATEELYSGSSEPKSVSILSPEEVHRVGNVA